MTYPSQSGTADQQEIVSNGSIALSFDKITGSLVDIRNLETGHSCLGGRARLGNPFAVYHTFFKEFEIGEQRHVTASPETIASGLFSPGKGVSARFRRPELSGNPALSITYEDTSEFWQATLIVEALGDEQSFRCRLDVKNLADKARPILGVFPLLSGVRLGTGRKNLMTVHDQGGYVRPLWTPKPTYPSHWPERGGIYGNALIMNMQWGCVFDEASQDALAFIIEDDQLRNKDICYERPSIQVRYFPPVTLAPGESMEFPPVRIMAYKGDWKPAAKAYHDWFTGAFKMVDHPEWVRRLDSHLGQWVSKRGQEMPEKTREVQGLHTWLSAFADLPGVHLRLPMDTIEYAFYCRSSMGPSASGKQFCHTDGDNVVREDLGGAAELRKAVRRVHRMGRHITLYVEGVIVPRDADILTKGQGMDWTITQKDGETSTMRDFVRMCPGATGWQDHLAETSARLVRETGVDGIRLDSLGHNFFSPCYNPKHSHSSPFDFNRWMCQLLQKVARAVRKVNPDCMLTTEGGIDFYAQYFDGCLDQCTNPAAMETNRRDVHTMRVALPEYGVMVHNPIGPVAASLSGFPGGNGGTQPGGYFSELDEKWRSARYAVAEAIRWGDAAHDNPRASRKDVTCRRFSSPGVDVVVGARCKPLRISSSPDMDNVNKNVDVKTDRVAFDVRIERMPEPPHNVYLLDVLNMTAREAPCCWQDEQGIVRVDCNWFVLVLAYDGALPLAVMDVPDIAMTGRECRVDVTLLGAPPDRRFRACLRAPSLGWTGDADGGLIVHVPGSLRVHVPEHVLPGKHIVTLDGTGFLGCKRFVTIDASGGGSFQLADEDARRAAALSFAHDSGTLP